MAVHFKRQSNHIIVFGQTYPHRQIIRDLGGRFLRQQKVWQIPFSEQSLEQIHLLSKATGGAQMDSAQNDSQSPNQPEPIKDIPQPTEVDSKFLDHYIGKIEKNHRSSLATANKETSSYSVSQLMMEISGVVSRAFPQAVWVKGEVQNLGKRGRTIFLNLAEGIEGANEAATTTVSSTIWSNQFQKITQKHGEKVIHDILQDGIEIRCLCQVSVYKGRGSVSLQILDIDPSFTKGSLALAREKLLKELRLKGLDQKNKSTFLPTLPLTLGLISAKGSRAESDFLHQLVVGGYPGKVLFVHSAMQGEKVPKGVEKAIQTLLEANVDLIVLTRGGGSAADLRWFDAPEVAYAIANSDVPILAAIGHHDDYCVAEEICFQRAKTPTAAADYLLSCVAEFRERVRTASERLAISLERALDRESKRQAYLAERITQFSENRCNQEINRLTKITSFTIQKVAETLHQAKSQQQFLSNKIFEYSSRAIQTHQVNLHRYSSSVIQMSSQFLQTQELSLSNYEKKIAGYNPKPWLSKGWTRLSVDGESIKSIDSVKLQQVIEARLLDGTLKLSVLEKEPKTNNVGDN